MNGAAPGGRLGPEEGRGAFNSNQDTSGALIPLPHGPAIWAADTSNGPGVPSSGELDRSGSAIITSRCTTICGASRPFVCDQLDARMLLPGRLTQCFYGVDEVEFRAAAVTSMGIGIGIARPPLDPGGRPYLVPLRTWLVGDDPRDVGGGRPGVGRVLLALGRSKVVELQDRGPACSMALYLFGSIY